jgi:hypothetical protein
MQTAWTVTEGLLLTIRDEVKSHGAEFHLVVMATRPQVILDHSKRLEFMRELGIEDLNYADRRIADFSAREGIPLTILAPAFSAYAEANNTYLNGFNRTNFGTGHWNETGHRLAADVIAADLCRSAEGGSSQAARFGR